MKPLRPICTSLLLLVLGAAVPMDAQHDSRERDAKPSKQKPPREGRPEPREQRPDPRPEPRNEQRREPRPVPREQRPDPRPEPRKEQRHEPRPEPKQEARPETPSRQDRGRVPQAPRPSPQAPRPSPQAQRPPSREARGNQDKHRSVWQEHRAKNWQAEHRSWQDRGGYQGYRIPTARYRSHFGPRYGFRMYSYPLIVVGGMPRFQYGGFWFSVMDPWPEYWSDNWYGDDDVYIEYSVDGYYLYNRRHVGDRIAITVILN